MAPFPEAEDMTVKRLYVALKRDDMQLLQMGAHKLHEKFHTGYKFELLDDLRQILSYVEEQAIPNDIKDLLTKTIADILNGEKPDSSYIQDENNSSAESAEYRQTTADYEFKTSATEEENIPENTDESEIQNKIQNNNTANKEPQLILELEQNADSTAKRIEDENFVQDSLESDADIKKEAEPVIFTPKDTVINATNSIEETSKSKEDSFRTSTVVKIIEERESTLNNVAVFYDDKAPFIDFQKNKNYRIELDLTALNKNGNPMENAAAVKSIVDVQTDEFGEILKMLSTIKGDVYFITTSKSENLLKTFTEYQVNYEIPNVVSDNIGEKKVNLIPLFGLSNIFYCPKCGRRETVIAVKNKILSAECSNCAGVMYPDIYESLNYETNANPYYFIKGISLMAKAETWILINPPLEGSRALVSQFLRSAYETSKPKKVYILSKETTKKEYYKQMFKEIDETIDIRADFITQDSLCEEFINNEISTIKVNA